MDKEETAEWERALRRTREHRKRDPGPERIGNMVGDTLTRIRNRGKGSEKAKGKTTRPRKPYLFYMVPKWLPWSGLPTALNEKYGMQAWTIFTWLIILDCRYNPGFPDWFDQGYEELASLTGLSRRSISKYIRRFENAKLIRLVRGKFTGSKSRFKINNFRATPISPNKIPYRNGGLLGSKGKRPYLRYYERVKQRYPLGHDRE